MAKKKRRKQRIKAPEESVRPPLEEENMAAYPALAPPAFQLASASGPGGMGAESGGETMAPSTLQLKTAQNTATPFQLKEAPALPLGKPAAFDIPEIKAPEPPKVEGPKPFAPSGGSKMPEDVKGKMEGAMGADFSSVKIETNSKQAQEMGALAFAQGESVHFAPGQFDPSSKKGQELIGHELAHIQQQREGKVTANAQVGGAAINNDKGLEAEADRIGKAAAESSGPPIKFNKLAEQKPVDPKQHLANEPEELKAETKKAENSKVKQAKFPDAPFPNRVAKYKKENEQEEKEESREPEDIKKREQEPSAADGTPPNDDDNAEDKGKDKQKEKDPWTTFERDRFAEPRNEEKEEEEDNGKAGGGGGGEDKKEENKDDSEPKNEEQSDSSAESETPPAPEAKESSPETVASTEAPQPSAKSLTAPEPFAGIPNEPSALSQQVAAELQGLKSQKVEFQQPEVDEMGAIIQMQQDPQAETEAYIEQEKSAAGAAVGGFNSASTGNISSLTTVSQSVPSQINTAALTASATIDAAVIQEQQNTTTHYATLYADITTALTDAESVIQGFYDTRLGNIETKNTEVGDALVLAHGDAVQEIEDALVIQQKAISDAYLAIHPTFVEKGVIVGDAAKGEADTEADGYLGSKTGNMGNPLDYYLEDRKLDARAEAAREVGVQFKASLEQEASAQADAAMAGIAVDQQAARDRADEYIAILDEALVMAQECLVLEYDKATANLLASQSAMNDLLSTMAQNKTGELESQELEQLDAISSMGEQHKLSLEGIASNMCDAIQAGVDGTASQLASMVSSFNSTLSGISVPDSSKLSDVISGVESEIGSTVQSISQAVATELTSAADALTNMATAIGEGITTLATEGNAVATTQTTEFTGLIADCANSSDTTFGEIEDAFGLMADGIEETTGTAFSDTVGALEDAFEADLITINENLEASAVSLEEGLTAAYKDQLPGVMKAECDDAESQVKPKWQGILKILLVIIVVVLLTLVLGPLVLGAVGAAVGAVVSSAAAATVITAVVSGAILGALGNGMIEFGNNAIELAVTGGEFTAENLFKDVDRMMIQGAIGGAIGGGIGAGAGMWVSSLANGGASMAVQRGITFVADFGGDMLGDYVGNLAIGEQSSLGDLAMGAATNFLVSGGIDGVLGRFPKVAEFQLNMTTFGANAPAYTRYMLDPSGYRGPYNFDGSVRAENIGDIPDLAENLQSVRTGNEQAELLGWGPAPAGYRWAKRGNGNPPALRVINKNNNPQFNGAVDGGNGTPGGNTLFGNYYDHNQIDRGNPYAAITSSGMYDLSNPTDFANTPLLYNPESGNWEAVEFEHGQYSNILGEEQIPTDPTTFEVEPPDFSDVEWEMPHEIENEEEEAP